MGKGCYQPLHVIIFNNQGKIIILIILHINDVTQISPVKQVELMEKKPKYQTISS